MINFLMSYVCALIGNY